MGECESTQTGFQVGARGDSDGGGHFALCEFAHPSQGEIRRVLECDRLNGRIREQVASFMALLPVYLMEVS